MNKSESISNIAKALISFSQKVDRIKKTETNPFFKSKFAPLPDIIMAIQSPLAESGLSYSQMPDGLNLTTILMHESGEWIESSYPLNPVKNDPQSFGSAITYARRYALGAVLGLSIDDDDDANASTQPAPDRKTEDGGYINFLTPTTKTTPTPENKQQQKPWLNEGTVYFDNALKGMREGKTIKDIREHYAVNNTVAQKLQELANQPA